MQVSSSPSSLEFVEPLAHRDAESHVGFLLLIFVFSGSCFRFIVLGFEHLLKACHISSPKEHCPEEQVKPRRHFSEFGKCLFRSFQQEDRGPTVLHSHNLWGCVQSLLVWLSLPLEPEVRLQILGTEGHVWWSRWRHTEWVPRMQLCVIWWNWRQRNFFEVLQAVSVTHKSPQNMQQWGKAWSKRWTRLVD
jgi:hypothetical protein